MDRHEGGERKQTERQRDRQIKRYVCQKDMGGKNAREKKDAKGTLRFRTLCIKMYILRYIHHCNICCTVSRTYPLHCYKEKVPLLLLYSKVFDLWTSAEFHLFLKTQLSRVFETSHDHIIFLGP
jgi:hypothetical protein